MTLLAGYPKRGTIESSSTLDKEPTRFQVSMYERGWNNLMGKIDELEHKGAPLDSEMVLAIVQDLDETHDAAQNLIEFQVKYRGEPEYKPIKLAELENEVKELREVRAKEREIKEPKASDPYYRKTVKGDYTLEEAGPKEGQPEIFVVSNPADARNTAYKHELEIAQKISKEHNIPLERVTLYVEQGNGEYLPRTFREYPLTPGEAGKEEPKRSLIQQNYEDVKGGYLTRMQIEGEIAQAREPARAYQQDRAQEIDLSKETINRER